MNASASAKVSVLARAIGSRIRARRTSLGLTQQQLAEMAGVSTRLLRSMEMGTAYGVGLENIVAVLEPLDLRLELAGAGEEKRPRKEAVTQDSEYTDALRHAVDGWSGGREGA